MRRIFLALSCAFFTHFSYAVDGFGYVVKVKRTQVHAGPSKDSLVVEELGVTTRLAVSSVDPKKGDWLHHEPTAPDAKKGWILRHEVAGAEDFVPVASCWPIKEVSAPEGEATYQKIVFTTKGSAKLVSNDGSKWPARTYMAGELVLVRVTSRSKEAPFGEFLHLEKKTKSIFPNGEAPMHQELFSDEQLHNCRQVVLK